MKENKDNQEPNVGKIIQVIVKEKNISISDFAKAIHCSRTNVYNIFGRHSIDIKRLKQIAGVLKLDVSELIGENKNESNKHIVIIETDDEGLERISNGHNSGYIKHWKAK
ncbi:MAG: helix-turn-helix transcriptional regulator [Dysgonamonadaceae bacterium]|jgi:transcriptional regulator with XRE-family HTH domain|nr:helix-turn-helix transcriptional regulator [Dysgonamonadaceae bacterium]